MLIGAADDVANGDLDVRVPVKTSDGDVGNLSKTFNNMIEEVRVHSPQLSNHTGDRLTDSKDNLF
jgi:two-component system nitrogen regulation sensor histidine kinase NtrY